MSEQKCFKQYSAVMLLIYAIIKDPRTPRSLRKDINDILEFITGIEEDSDISYIEEMLQGIYNKVDVMELMEGLKIVDKGVQ